MPYLICVFLIMTGLLLFTSFYQSIQIYFMKRELRKCLKTIARCKTNLNSENRCNERKFNQSLIGENREKREEKEEREKLENCIKAIQQIKKSLKDMEEF